MCGIVGILSQGVNQALFDALTVLQHRGQDAAGIATCQGSHFHSRKGNGLVREVFQAWHMQKLVGNFGIGHVRYPTAGARDEQEAQPFYVNSPFGIMLAHNGNLTNAQALAQSLFHQDFRHINTGSDSEVILNVFAHELQRVCELELTKEAIFRAVEGVHRRCRGAYAVVLLIAGAGMVAFRDPFGIRPLIYGTKQVEGKTEVMVASESAALTSLGFSQLQDVAPGEALFIQESGNIARSQCAKKVQLSPCLFEYIYFARPDSVIDQISVYQLRLNMGQQLALKLREAWPSYEIDAVIPIPETSRSVAMALAHALGLAFREGFIKNRYVGRTFIMPGQVVRKKSVRQKLSVIESEMRGKNVLLVDDSIVRGTTSKELIQMARVAGAKKVYFASAAPPVRFPNIYGIDMPTVHELVAHNRSVSEVKDCIGADDLLYLELESLTALAKSFNPLITHFEESVFSGHYLTGDEHEYLLKVEKERGESFC